MADMSLGTATNKLHVFPFGAEAASDQPWQAAWFFRVYANETFWFFSERFKCVCIFIQERLMLINLRLPQSSCQL